MTTTGGASGRRPTAGHRVAIHVVGALSTAAACAAAFVAMAVVGFGNSYCADAPPKGARLHLAMWMLAIGGSLAAVPIGTAFVARRAGTSATVWWTLGIVVSALTISIAATIEPSRWCF